MFKGLKTEISVCLEDNCNPKLHICKKYVIETSVFRAEIRRGKCQNCALGDQCVQHGGGSIVRDLWTPVWKEIK